MVRWEASNSTLRLQPVDCRRISPLNPACQWTSVRCLSAVDYTLRSSVDLCQFAACAILSLQAAQPDVVMIVADDLGWGDVGCFGSTDLQHSRLGSTRPTRSALVELLRQLLRLLADPGIPANRLLSRSRWGSRRDTHARQQQLGPA